MDADDPGFYSMPWPNDIRRYEDGSLKLGNFPPALKNPVFMWTTQIGMHHSNGFGNNAAVYFRLTDNFDPQTLPHVNDSREDTSPLLLVNIDPNSDFYLDRVPVVADFKAEGTFYREKNLLALLPAPGYALAPSSRYAVILFDNLNDDKGRSLKKPSLLRKLDRTWRESTGLTEAEFFQLREQKQAVFNFVEGETARSTDEVIGFTVFTTQDPTADALLVGQALNTMSDEFILDKVESLTLQNDCRCVDGDCPSHVLFYGKVSLPHWQKGLDPYLLLGGGINKTDEGEAKPSRYTSENFSLSIGCAAPPEAGRSQMIYAPGSGGSYSYAAGRVARYYENFNHTAIGVTPYRSSDRKSEWADEIKQFGETFGFNLDQTTVNSLLFYNYLNPVSANASHIQGAADQIFIRRVIAQLPALMAKFNVTPEALGLSEDGFKLNDGHAGFVGQSQGATQAPLTFAMDSGFKFAALNGASGVGYPVHVHRRIARETLNQLFVGIGDDELDEFHPIIQMYQTFLEPWSPVNYTSMMNLDNIFITGGYADSCTTRESTYALALALARENKIPEGRITYSPNGVELELEELWPHPSINELLGTPKVVLPGYVDTGLNGNVNLFVMLADNHWALTARDMYVDYLDAVTNGGEPYLNLPDGEYYSTVCGGYVD